MNRPPLPTAVYEEFAPDPALQHWVAYSWRFRAVEAGRHPIPPETGFTLSAIPELGFVSLRGPHDHAIEVDAPAGLRVVGLRLWPGTQAGLETGKPIEPEQWVDREEPADGWVPALSAALLLALETMDDVSDGEPGARLPRALDRTLARVAYDAGRLDHAIVSSAFRMLGRTPTASVAALASDLGLSPRQFRRRFRRAIGLSPRAFRRARRIRLALEEAVLPSSAAWIDLAGSHGYADQAHLCREFRQTTGRSPRGYVESVRHIEHHLAGGRNVQDAEPADR